MCPYSVFKPTNGLPKAANLFKTANPTLPTTTTTSGFVFGQNVHERVTGVCKTYTLTIICLIIINIFSSLINHSGIHPRIQFCLNVVAGHLFGHVQSAVRNRRIERPATGQCRNASRRGKRRESKRGGSRLRRESCAKAKIRRSENVHRRGKRNECAGRQQQAVHVRCWQLGGTGSG